MTTKKEYNIEEHVYEMLLELYKLECSSPFRQPVDVILLQCPNYYEVIKSPMDLSTLKANYKDGMYTMVDEVLQQLLQIVKNCRTYNTGNHPLTKTCDKFEACILSRWKGLQEKIKKLEFGQLLNVETDKLDNIDRKKSKKRDPALPPQSSYHNEEPIKKKPKLIEPVIKPHNESIFLEDEPIIIQKSSHNPIPKHDLQKNTIINNNNITHFSPINSIPLPKVLEQLKVDPQIKQETVHSKTQLDHIKEEVQLRKVVSLPQPQDQFDDMLDNQDALKYQILIQHKSSERNKDVTKIENHDIIKKEEPAVPQISIPQISIPQISMPQISTPQIKTPIIDQVQAAPQTLQAPQSPPPITQIIRSKSIVDQPTKRSILNTQFKISLKKDEIQQSYKDNQVQKIRKNKKFITKVLNAFLMSLSQQRDKIQKIYPGGEFISLRILEESYKQVIIGMDASQIFYILRMQILWLKHNLMNLVFSDLQDMHRYCSLVCRSLKVLKLAQKRHEKLKGIMSVEPKSAQKESIDATVEFEPMESRALLFEEQLASEVKTYQKAVVHSIQSEEQPLITEQLSYLTPDKKGDQNYNTIPSMKLHTQSSMQLEDEEQGKENIFQVYLQSYNEKFLQETSLLSQLNYKRLFKGHKKQQPERVEDGEQLIKMEGWELAPVKKQNVPQPTSVFDDWPSEQTTIEGDLKIQETFNRDQIFLDQDEIFDEEGLQKIQYIVQRIIKQQVM